MWNLISYFHSSYLSRSSCFFKIPNYIWPNTIGRHLLWSLVAWVETSCEIVCRLTSRELSKPETLGIGFPNGCRALLPDTEPPTHTAGVDPGARKDTRGTVNPLSQVLARGSALGWIVSHLLPGTGRLKVLGRDGSLLLKTQLWILQVRR